MQRKFIGARELLLDSYRLALRVFRGGFRPTFLVGLWPGGSAVGMAVQECLDYLGVATDHACVRIFDSEPRDDPGRAVDSGGQTLHGAEDLIVKLDPADSLLVVDAVCGPGSSVAALLSRLRDRLGPEFHDRARVAAIWHRPAPRAARLPDYFLHETSDWIVLPHELAGLSLEEIRAHKPGLREILDGLRQLPEAAALFGSRPRH